MGIDLNRKLIRIIKKQDARIAKLERELYLDYGTGVLNKRQGFSILKKEIEICRRINMPMSIAFVDVDKLKSINDKFGHCEGDKLLNKIAKIIRKNIRKDDIVFRYGGDEFIVVFKNANIEKAKAIWNRVMTNIFKENNKKKFPYILSTSVGFAEYKNNMSINELIECADRDMYKNKSAKYYRYINK